MEDDFVMVRRLGEIGGGDNIRLKDLFWIIPIIFILPFVVVLWVFEKIGNIPISPKLRSKNVKKRRTTKR